MNKPFVIVESPYAGDVKRNVLYARAAIRDCLLRGEVPFASHLLYTQDGVLDDNVGNERALGIEAGLEVGKRADKTVVYTDLGFSSGMKMGIAAANTCVPPRPIEYRTLNSWEIPEPELRSKTVREWIMECL